MQKERWREWKKQPQTSQTCTYRNWFKSGYLRSSLSVASRTLPCFPQCPGDLVESSLTGSGEVWSSNVTNMKWLLCAFLKKDLFYTYLCVYVWVCVVHLWVQILKETGVTEVVSHPMWVLEIELRFWRRNKHCQLLNHPSSPSLQHCW